jgi:Ser/Thr protein kinase RdoA (MazF antagonist)
VTWAAQIAERYPQLGAVTCVPAHALVNQVMAVHSAAGRFALKLYRPGLRSVSEIRSEVGLVRHLRKAGAPVPEIVSGRTGPVEKFSVNGSTRMAVLSRWAPGVKPAPTTQVYELLGLAAAEIHAAADSYQAEWTRPPADLRAILERPLALLKPALVGAGFWPPVASLAARLRAFVESADLDWGHLSPRPVSRQRPSRR